MDRRRSVGTFHGKPVTAKGPRDGEGVTLSSQQVSPDSPPPSTVANGSRALPSTTLVLVGSDEYTLLEWTFSGCWGNCLGCTHLPDIAQHPFPGEGVTESLPY